MKPKSSASRVSSLHAFAMASFITIQLPAQAATISKLDNAIDLNLAASWSGAVVPGVNDIAQWDSTVTGANSSLLGGDLSFSGIKVTNPEGAVTLGEGSTLTVGASGIDLSAATQNLTIGSDLALKGGQSWSTAVGKTLDVAGTFSKSGGAVSFTNFSGALGTLTNDVSGILGPWATSGSGTAVAYATTTAGTVSGISATAPTPLTAAGATSPTVNFRTSGALTMTGAVDANTLTLNSPSTTSLTTRQIKNLTFGMKLNGILSAGAWTGPGGVPTALTSALFQIGETSAATALTSAPLTIGDNKVLHVSGNGATQRLSATLAQSNLVINIPIIDNPGGSSSLVVSGLNAIPNNTTSLADSVILGTTGSSSLVGPYNTFTGGVVVASGILRAGSFANLCLGGGSTITPGTQASPVNVTVEKGAILRPDRNIFKGNLTLNGGAIWPSNGFGDAWQAFNGVGSITLGADSVFYTSSSGNFTVSVPVTGPGGLTKTGSANGKVVLTGNNTYSGPTKVWGGVLAIQKAAGLYNGDTSQWTASNITVEPIGYSPAGTAPTTNLNPTLLLSVGGTDEFTGDQITTLLSNLSAVGTGGLRDGSYFGMDTTNATSEVDITSNLSRAVNYKFSGKGTVKLSGMNTYTGKTAVDGVSGSSVAKLSVSSFNSVVGGTASSSLGAPTTVANGTIDLGSNGNSNKSTIVYTGAGETTDRVLNYAGQLGASNAIDQSGTGLLKFTSPFTFFGGTGYAKDVILQGSTAGTGEIAGAIVDATGTGSQTGVSKRGSGTWTLSGANTYTGATTVWEGRLIIGGASQLGGGNYAASIPLTSNFSGGPSGATPEIFFNSSADQTLSGFIYSNGTTGTLRKGGASTLTLAPVASVDATATAAVSGGIVTAITLNPGTGTGYDDVPLTVTITGDGTGATATADAYFFDGKVSVTLTNGGTGYTTAPTVTISPAPNPYRTNVYDNTVVEAGVLVVNGYSLYNDSSLSITGGKVRAAGTEIVGMLYLDGVPMPLGTYGASGSGASHIDDVHFLGSTGVVQATLFPTFYADWLATYLLTGDDALPTADLDGDGLVNALEFVFGGDPDPFTADPAGSNSIGLLPTVSQTSRDLVFTFKRTDVSELETTLVFQWSTDLNFPTANNVPVGAVDSVTDGITVDVNEDSPDAATDTIVITVPAAKAVNGKLLGRLSALVPFTP
jgi:autotransporter-associated beta strand protein